MKEDSRMFLIHFKIVMGVNHSSPTFNFFIDNFGERKEFILDFQDKRILFSYREKDVTKNKIKISMEVLDRPHEKSSVTIRSLGNCQCKSDAKSYEPSATFFICYNLDGFHDKRYINSSDEFKILLDNIEKEIMDYRK